MPESAPVVFIGVDVGTGSARAGVFDPRGNMLGSAKQDIEIYREPGDIVEQSSADIWQAVCGSVRKAVENAGIDRSAVAGISFDATCSLVVLGQDGQPISVSPSGNVERNIIVWMDHRAVDQANRINQTGADVLRYVGGTISPEMQTPKLLWLAENMPDTFANAWQFMDLTDFLTWKSSGSIARSVCTVTCKWTYLAHERRWDPSYFKGIGLGSLAEEGFARIGTEIVDAGTPLGNGLTAEAASELGLPEGIAVGAGLIDAHAGGIGTVGATGSGNIQTRMAYVFGTSACTMSTTSEPAFVDGVWGPYYSAMAPGLWLNEGGQSAAGAAIDHLVLHHPAACEAAARASECKMNLTQWLAVEAAELGGASRLPHFVGSLHVVPEFLGNRAPFADPNARAVIAGLGMASDLDSLVGLYLAGVCGLGYGLRQILDAQVARGISIDTVVVSGGAGQDPTVRQVLADAAGTVITSSTSPEPVLLGTAILAAVAGGHFPSVYEAMQSMSTLGEVHLPSKDDAEWHGRRYAAFKLLQQAARAAR